MAHYLQRVQVADSLNQISNSLWCYLYRKKDVICNRKGRKIVQDLKDLLPVHVNWPWMVLPRHQTDKQQWLLLVLRRSRLLVTIVSVLWPTIFKGCKWLILWIKSPIPFDVIYTGKRTLFVTEKDARSCKIWKTNYQCMWIDLEWYCPDIRQTSSNDYYWSLEGVAYLLQLFLFCGPLSSKGASGWFSESNLQFPLMLFIQEKGRYL